MPLRHPVPDSTGPLHRPTGAIIDVTGLIKTYGTERVVDRVDLQVESGEIFGLLGANGAGKTTTVECLQGLRRADSGQIRVLGMDPVADRNRLRTVIGSQLQDAALPDRLRVGEAVELFDVARRASPVDELARWGLADKIDTGFADLSGGQRQRLLIVLALLNRPRLIFLDELTQGLDPAARRDVWQQIRQVRDDGATIVLVSHFADEVEALCDRVAVMSRGRVVASGTPRELTDRHGVATTITFTAPTGFDPDRLLRSGDVAEVDAADGRIRVVGTSAMVAPVCAATLDENGGGPADLRVSHPSLDDALVNLIGDR